MSNSRLSWPDVHGTTPSPFPEEALRHELLPLSDAKWDLEMEAAAPDTENSRRRQIAEFIDLIKLGINQAYLRAGMKLCPDIEQIKPQESKSEHHILSWKPN